MRYFIGVFMMLVTTVGWSSEIGVAGLPATVRVRPEGVVDGSDSIAIQAARGEVESFQVVVTAEKGMLYGVQAKVSTLTDGKGNTIPTENVRLFREIFVPVRESAPRATMPPGWFPDPLVPFVDPYTEKTVKAQRWTGRELEDGRRFGAVGFNLWEGHHQPIWIDVRIPREAAPGIYQGEVTVSAKGGASAKLPVSLEVWDFTLPKGPSHENHFGGFAYALRYHGVKATEERGQVLEERYSAMMAAHRINPEVPHRLLPQPGEDGALIFEEKHDQQISAFVEKYHVTNLSVPRAPFKDSLGANREKSIRFFQSWESYLRDKGWLDRAYHYMLDEPNDPAAYERVRQLGALAKEAAPDLRRLVVEQPYTQDPEWGTLDGSIDIWCPLFGFVHEPSIKRVQAQGDDVWSYSALVQSAPPYHPDYEKVRKDNPPYWEIDFPVMSYRIAPWLNRRYGITGLLYWSTVYWKSPDRDPWLDPGFRLRWNGDGALFYPGDDAGIEGPIASIRLKNLRDGMEDYEYFVLLEALGGKEAVDKIVREAVPTWGSWNQDPHQIYQLRQRLAEAILERQ